MYSRFGQRLNSWHVKVHHLAPPRNLFKFKPFHSLPVPLPFLPPLSFFLPHIISLQVHYITCNTTSLTQSQASILTITCIGTYIPRTTYSGYIRDYFAACINIIPFPLLILLITCTQELYYIFPNHTWFLFLSLV